MSRKERFREPNTILGEVIGKKEKIKPEEIGQWRKEVAELREKKNPVAQYKALVTARRVKEVAKENQMFDQAVELCWEEYLVGKHIYKGTELFAWMPGIEKLQQEGWKIMEQAVEESEELISEHSEDKYVKRVKPRMGRFAGEVEMLQGNYQAAIEKYEQSIKQYQQKSRMEQRINILELKGFLAEALIKAGGEQQERGIKLGVETFNQYKDSPEGKWLKENDYYTWAVWRSGCAVKTSRGLLESGVEVTELDPQIQGELAWMLIYSQGILENPPEPGDMWGDQGIRIEEVENTYKALEARRNKAD